MFIDRASGIPALRQEGHVDVPNLHHGCTLPSWRRATSRRSASINIYKHGPPGGGRTHLSEVVMPRTIAGYREPVAPNFAWLSRPSTAVQSMLEKNASMYFGRSAGL